jgi:hypothetical protein
MKLTQPSLSSPSAPTVSATALNTSTELGLVRSGLVAEYRFNEGSGQILYDYSGNNNHGTLGSTTGADTNDPTYAGGGASFTTDDYIVGPTTLKYSSFTFQIAINNAGGDAYQAIIADSTGTTATGKAGYFLRKTDTSKRYQFRIYDAAGNEQNSGITGLTNGTWGLLTGTFDGTTIKSFLGATLADSVACTGITQSSQALYIGRYSYTTAGYFGGSIAYLAIYNRALTQAEITQNYNYLKSYLLRERGIALA